MKKQIDNTENFSPRCATSALSCWLGGVKKLFTWEILSHFEIFIKNKKENDCWEYGTCGANKTYARRHKKNGNVQFVLWKKGEQGHKQDYWHDFDSSWWKTFNTSA